MMLRRWAEPSRCRRPGLVAAASLLSALLLTCSCSAANAPQNAEGGGEAETISLVGFTAGSVTQLAADAIAETVRTTYPEWKVDSMVAGSESRLTAMRIAGEADFYFARSSRALEIEAQAPLHPGMDLHEVGGYRLVMPFSYQYLHLIVLDRTGMSGLADIVGQRYAFRLGCGVSTASLFSKILEYYGAALEQAKQWGATHETVVISTSEGVEALQTGRVDVGFTWGPIPNPVLMGASLSASLLDLNEPGLIDMLADWGCVPATIPAGTYAFVDADVHTAAFPYALVARADLPDDVVYHVVKALFDNPEVLQAVNADARTQMAPESVAASVLLSRSVGEPYHPGALTFFREKGWVD